MRSFHLIQRWYHRSFEGLYAYGERHSSSNTRHRDIEERICFGHLISLRVDFQSCFNVDGSSNQRWATETVTGHSFLPCPVLYDEKCHCSALYYRVGQDVLQDWNYFSLICLTTSGGATVWRDRAQATWKVLSPTENSPRPPQKNWKIFNSTFSHEWSETILIVAKQNTFLKSQQFQFTIWHHGKETLQDATKKMWNDEVFFSSYQQETTECWRAFRISTVEPCKIHRIIWPDFLSPHRLFTHWAQLSVFIEKLYLWRKISLRRVWRVRISYRYWSYRRLQPSYLCWCQRTKEWIYRD